jgi:hypothetical protein
MMMPKGLSLPHPFHTVPPSGGIDENAKCPKKTFSAKSAKMGNREKYRGFQNERREGKGKRQQVKEYENAEK